MGTVENQNQDKINLQEQAQKKADKLKALSESDTLLVQWIEEVLHFPGNKKAAQYLIDLREQRETLEAKQKEAEKNA
jgi:hypothetical protein